MYRIEFTATASKDLAELRAYERAAIVRGIFEQLTHEPRTPTRNRKLLAGVVPPFDAAPPLWQLRVGEYRVFYDVNEEERKVLVRTLRHKPPHRATEEVL